MALPGTVQLAPRDPSSGALALSLAQRLDDPYALGMVHLAGGMSEFCVGRWPSACRSARCKPSRSFRIAAGVSPGSAARPSCSCCCRPPHDGRVCRGGAPFRPALKDARERGDVYSAIMNGAHIGAKVHLAADDVDGARGLVRELLGDWPSAISTPSNCTPSGEKPCIDLYSGDGIAAWDRLSRIWPLTPRAAKRPDHPHLDAIVPLPACALAAAGQARSGTAMPLLAAAEADARRLEGTKVAVAAALAQLSRAGVASSRGDDKPCPRIDSPEQSKTWKRSPCTPTPPRRGGASACCWGARKVRRLVDQADSWMRSQGSATRPGWPPCTPQVSWSSMNWLTAL